MTVPTCGGYRRSSDRSSSRAWRLSLSTVVGCGGAGACAIAIVESASKPAARHHRIFMTGNTQKSARGAHTLLRSASYAPTSHHPHPFGRTGIWQRGAAVHRKRLLESDRPRQDETPAALRRRLGSVVTHLSLDARVRLHG